MLELRNNLRDSIIDLVKYSGPLSKQEIVEYFSYIKEQDVIEVITSGIQCGWLNLNQDMKLEVVEEEKIAYWG